MARTQIVRVLESIQIRRPPESDGSYTGAIQPADPSLDLSWTSGTGDDQSDLMWSSYEASVAGSGTLSLDLDALTNGPEGETVSLTEVRAILITNKSTVGDEVVTLSPNASNGWTALGASLSLDVHPGASLRLYAPEDGSLPVGASDKVLDLDNAGAAAATLDIVILGTSA